MTSLVRYQPFLPMRDIFDRILNDGFFAPQSESFTNDIAVDVKESDNEYVLTASVPGVTVEDISIELENGVVSISGQVSSENGTENKGYLLRERKMGGFQRRLRLPNVLDAEKATAVLETGVLSLTIPKVEKAKSSIVAVEID